MRNTIKPIMLYLVMPLFLTFVLLSGIFIVEHNGILPDLGIKHYLLIITIINTAYFTKIRLIRRYYNLLLVVFVNILLLEIMCQIAVLFGLVPGMRIMWQTPYGRSFHSAEGYSNGLMNRWGWHYKNFNLKDDAEKIALIGDSFIEAHEIDPSQHMGVHLESELNTKGVFQHPVQVMAFGLTGTGPAQYFELLKYSWRHFKPKTAIVFLFLGNDFSNSLLEAKSTLRQPPSEYIYYTLSDSNSLVLHPESKMALQDMNDFLESNFAGSPGQYLKTFFGYIMLPQIVANIIQKIRFYFKKEALQKAESDPAAEGLNRVGLAYDAFTFRQPADKLAQKAYRIVSLLMLKMHQYAQEKHINLIFVTIPHFPEFFYQTQHGNEWSMQYQNYDFLYPEKYLGEFADKHHIQFWKTGEWMHQAGLSVEEIQQLYFLNGCGHLTPKGHAFFGKYLAERLLFFSTRSSAINIKNVQ
jgi:hypothetical protein